jgi:hypothetical protein
MMLLGLYVRQKNIFDHEPSCNTTSFLVHLLRKITPNLFVQKLCGLLSPNPHPAKNSIILLERLARERGQIEVNSTICEKI